MCHSAPLSQDMYDVTVFADETNRHQDQVKFAVVTADVLARTTTKGQSLPNKLREGKMGKRI